MTAMTGPGRGTKYKDVMSLLQGLRCLRCGELHPKNTRLSRCPTCAGLLDPEYDYAGLLQTFDWNSFRHGQRSIWRWRTLLPLEDDRFQVTLGEGDTPLVHCPRLGAQLGLDRLFVKNDGLNPTGSLKDRSIAVGIAKAREFGYRTVSVDSSGNKAASVAAYAARAGLSALVFCPSTASQQKLLQIKAYGAELVIVDGDRDITARVYRELLRRHDDEWYDVGGQNPFRAEGKKTYAYELAEAFGKRSPDWILQPAGGSAAVTKTWKGFKELQQFGVVDAAPRMVAVQAERCAPIVRAFEQELAEVLPVAARSSIAGGVAIPDPGDIGTLTLQVVRQSNGAAVAVTEKEILWGMRQLAEEGIFAEPTAAVTVPALARLVRAGMVKRDETVVCVVTGSGFKDMQTLETQVTLPRPVASSVAAIEAALARH
jgi:threonine synthase